MSRLPIRLRLTIPFAVAVAAVLGATGLFVYLRVGAELLTSVDQNLRAQAAESVHHVDEGHALLDRDLRVGVTIAEVLHPDGTVARSTPASLSPLLDAATLRRVLGGKTVLRAESVRGQQGSWRILAQPLAGGGGVLVIGRSLAPRDETLDRLGHEFFFATPVALVLAILAGYVLAASALRPVEAMRRRAEAVTADTPGRRLPVPPAQDELHALAVTLNAMLARLEAAFEHERRFVADASHELRTPLALLRTELELALRRPRSHDELEAAVRSAAEETERLTRLAEDLLLLARVDDGRLPLRRERVAAVELAERVRGRFASSMVAAGRRLEIDDPDEVDLEVDPDRIEQALGNLVANALDHGAGTVTVEIRGAGENVELHVTDEGSGFPAGFVDRAFDRFARVDDARSTRGTGLGLAIVAQIALAHGGQAHAANRTGGGADVWLLLPRHVAVPGVPQALIGR